MPNPFVHVELNTTDVDKAKAFYGKLFDWTLEDVPMGDSAYTMIKVGNGTGGGMMKHPVPGAPSAWLAYVQVDDIAAATQNIAIEALENVGRSDGRRLAEHPHRPHRSRAGSLEAQILTLRGPLPRPN